MLNYVWLGLIVIGILAAVSTDITDLASDKYGNDAVISGMFIQENGDKSNTGIAGTLVVPENEFLRIYGNKFRIINDFDAVYDTASKQLLISLSEKSPSVWKEIAQISGNEKTLFANVLSSDISENGDLQIRFQLASVSFVKIKNVTAAVLDYAKTAVTIALGLIGIMALWLGVMKVAEDAGLIRIIARMLAPLTKRLFPDVPSDHPAMGSIIMNISANMLGLGNAATPFGIKAMEELNNLNPDKGTATNSMVTFLAINTAGLTLIPATAIAVRAASGSADPTIIIGTSIFGAACATIAGVTAAKVIENLQSGFKPFLQSIRNNILKFIIALISVAAIFYILSSGILSSLFNGKISADAFRSFIQFFSTIAIPLIIILFIGFAAIRKVKVYEQFVEGAKEGFNVAVRIIPYLVAMLFAIGVFRESGALNWLIFVLQPLTNLIGMPAEAITMALMRPLSGSGSLGIMTEIMSVHGPDSFIGVLVSTFYGSTETTFYVLAVYFGAVNIRNTRHALPVGLIADAAGILGALFIVRLLFS